MEKLYFGVAYYPEHWPPERWPQDIRLMNEAHVNVVRMAEFAWSTMEPAEGQYNFQWLESVIRLLADAGIDVVLGTPTAAPPAWLVEKHPSILPKDENGRTVPFGNRCHFCVNSPEFHDASRRIIQRMAETFGGSPHVIGWQLDNEYNRVCYCDRCRELFQEFLREKYGTLDELNARWSTTYWSQTYSKWTQIPLPVGEHNPGLKLAFKHFVTRSYQNYQKMQLDILCPHLHPGAWVTHNFMGWFGAFDHYELTRDLDLASWDWYVGTGHHNYLTSGAIHDLTRGFKRKNFWLMETQPGHVHWTRTNNQLDKQEARLMAWHSVAHGADAVLYWQWRSAYGGQEQYHGTLIDQSGGPRPFYEEARNIGSEFAVVSDLLKDSTPQAKVALLNCYDSRWSIENQRLNSDFDYVEHFNHWYAPLSRRNLNLDVISADEEFDGYRLLIAPAMLVLDHDRARKLDAFVKRGGRLVLSLRTGMKDRHDAMLPMRQPGMLAELAGVEVEDFYSLESPVTVKGNLFEGTASLWAETLRILDSTKSTVVIARYGESNGWLDNQPAITVNTYGYGLVYLVGTWLDAASQQTLIDQILLNCNLKSWITPARVEIRTRTLQDGTSLYFILNHSRTRQVLKLPWNAFDHLTKMSVMQGELVLDPYAVALLTQE